MSPVYLVVSRCSEFGEFPKFEHALLNLQPLTRSRLSLLSYLPLSPFSTPDTHRPLFISNQVVDDYAENRVDTLHTKNLLHLGEDRYLTTLVLKHFGNYKTVFVRDGKAQTAAPEDWSVLLSQRRRWINSTVHNLFELLSTPGLCGFCLVSTLRKLHDFFLNADLLSSSLSFTVLDAFHRLHRSSLDYHRVSLFSRRSLSITLQLAYDLYSSLSDTHSPVTVAYLVYLVVLVTTTDGTIPTTSLIMLAAIYGLQAIIFILNRRFEMIGWMVVYIIGIPIWSLFLPLYSFWHMDVSRESMCRCRHSSLADVLLLLLSLRLSFFSGFLLGKHSCGHRRERSASHRSR